MDVEYKNWLENPTQDNLNKVVEAAAPIITSEIHRYAGPKTLLRGRAKLLAAKAIRTFNPAKGASLRTWVVGQMMPLNRYSHQLKPVRVAEDASRQAAELNSMRNKLSQQLGRQPTEEELADDTGINVRRIRKLESQVKPVMMEGAFDTAEDDDTSYAPALYTSSGMDLASESVYDSLDRRDRAIYDLKTGLHGKRPLSNADIATRLGLTPSAISQISDNISSRVLGAQANVI